VHDETDGKELDTGGGSDSATALLLSTWDDGEAEMIKQLLASYGIPTQVVSDVPHSVWPITVDGLGEVRVLVPAHRLEEARELLAEHRRQADAAEGPDR